MGSLKRLWTAVYEVVLFFGALACVLAYLEPKAAHMTGIPLPHWLWLVAALTLFGIGLWLSGYSLYLDLRKHKKEITEIKAAHALTEEQLRTRCNSDVDRANTVRDQYRAERDAAIADARAAKNAISGLIDDKDQAVREAFTAKANLATCQDNLMRLRGERDASKVRREQETLALEVITMSAAEYKRKLETEPGFRSRVDALPWDLKQGCPALSPQRVLSPPANTETELLSPLQVEALQLEKELRQWIRELGPRPDVKIGANEDSAAYLRRVSEAVTPWSNKLVFGYGNRFRDRIVNLAHRFAEQGPRDFTLENTQGISNEQQAADIAKRIRALAFQEDSDGKA